MEHGMSDKKRVLIAGAGPVGFTLAYNLARRGIPCTILVPEGNSAEKNAAMRSLGVRLIEHGKDFQESREQALLIAAGTGAHFVPSFHRTLVLGVSTYWLEFLRAVPGLEVVYVPIGLGSGACAAIAAKVALGHRVRVVGVVSALATTYRDSLAAGHVVASPARTVLADGMAVRIADAEALEILKIHLDHLVEVSDEEVAQSMRDLYSCTHNVAEGAGAASFAGAMKERGQLRGQVVGTTLCGGNVDASLFAKVLAGTD
jgi:threonine dehydratase